MFFFFLFNRLEHGRLNLLPLKEDCLGKLQGIPIIDPVRYLVLRAVSGGIACEMSLPAVCHKFQYSGALALSGSVRSLFHCLDDCLDVISVQAEAGHFVSLAPCF